MSALRFARELAAPQDGCVSRVVGTITERPIVLGKSLFTGGEKFIARGVTYGPFRPDETGCTYHNPEIVSRDFAMMAGHGINAVRTYTCPPRWLLDVAAQHGLRVMIGVALAGEQLSAFLGDRKTVRAVRQRCARDVRSCAGHPALLAYSIGNEIPATIVRWHGRHAIQAFLRGLYDISKEHDASGLVTYVNYPTTEYLQLPFLDFHSFNVYLERREAFDAYLQRLQNIADYKPLVMAEIGLDSLRNGEPMQASSLAWQIRSTFAAGCAGAFVFSWTDEWHTGGAEVTDWKFGITDPRRTPKPAFAAVGDAYHDAPIADDGKSPRISVVVATYNGSRTLADCLDGCSKLKYPQYEVIVVNDGSTDSTPDIARKFDVRLINTPNNGLSRARNRGLEAATGEIIAYIDDDARPDEHWLRFIAHAFATTDHVGIGGPNIVPVSDPPFAQCVANSPGGPTHVLITDDLAEHIPGCNMAFRADKLRAVGGFDEQFRIAGDDVDVCWKLQERGWTLGFHPGAVVYHHRRTTLKAYWRQQLNYGRAEAMLEAKWPEKYNTLGHVGWQGRLYGTGSCRGLGWFPSRVYHGVWATAAFQPLCSSESLISLLPVMPEWYLIMVCLALIGALGAFWTPLLVFLPLAILGAGATLLQATRHASSATFPHMGRGKRCRLVAFTAFLHLLQPIARLRGRLSYGLTPWRRQTDHPRALPRTREVSVWDERWQPAEERLKAVEAILRAKKAQVRRGGGFSNWDLEIRGGFFASARARLGIEDYPGGKQFLRFRLWPMFCLPAVALALLPVGMALLAMRQSPWMAGAFASVALLLLVRTIGDCAAATGCLLAAIHTYDKSVQPVPMSDLASASAVVTDVLKVSGKPRMLAHSDDAQPRIVLASTAMGGKPS